MKKKLFLRGALGFPIGIAIGYVITICISLRWAGGYYSPCVPELAEALGSEIGAVALQALLCGLLGTGFAASSVIWEMESWSLVRQTGVCFLSNSLIMLPIAYAMHWMEHSVAGFLSYFGVFVLIFVVIWGVQFAIGKQNVKKMNEKISEEKQD